MHLAIASTPALDAVEELGPRCGPLSRPERFSLKLEGPEETWRCREGLRGIPAGGVGLFSLLIRTLWDARSVFRV